MPAERYLSFRLRLVVVALAVVATLRRLGSFLRGVSSTDTPGEVRGGADEETSDEHPWYVRGACAISSDEPISLQC
jgi:hypothetical protein